MILVNTFNTICPKAPIWLKNYKLFIDALSYQKLNLTLHPNRNSSAHNKLNLYNMNATTYRLTKVVTNSASTINAIVDAKVYRNDVGNHIKTDLRNTLNELSHYMDEYSKGKLSCFEIHSCLVDTRLKLSELSDQITDKVLIDDPHLLLTSTVFDSLTTLRQILYILMTQIAMHEL